MIRHECQQEKGAVLLPRMSITEPVLRCDAGPSPRSGSLCIEAAPVVKWWGRWPISDGLTNLSSASSIQQLPVSELWGLRTRLFVTSGIALRGKLLKARQVKLGQVAAVLTEWKDNIEPEHHLRRWGNRVVLLGHSQSSVTLRHTVINVVTMTMDQNMVNIKSWGFPRS